MLGPPLRQKKRHFALTTYSMRGFALPTCKVSNRATICGLAARFISCLTFHTPLLLAKEFDL